MAKMRPVGYCSSQAWSGSSREPPRRSSRRSAPSCASPTARSPDQGRSGRQRDPPPVTLSVTAQLPADLHCYHHDELSRRVFGVRELSGLPWSSISPVSRSRTGRSGRGSNPASVSWSVGASGTNVQAASARSASGWTGCAASQSIARRLSTLDQDHCYLHCRDRAPFVKQDHPTYIRRWPPTRLAPAKIRARYRPCRCKSVAECRDDGNQCGWVRRFVGHAWRSRGQMSGLVLNRGTGDGESEEERYPRDGRKQRGDLDGRCVAIVCVLAGAPQQPQGEELGSGHRCPTRPRCGIGRGAASRG